MSDDKSDKQEPASLKPEIISTRLDASLRGVRLHADLRKSLALDDSHMKSVDESLKEATAVATAQLSSAIHSAAQAATISTTQAYANSISCTVTSAQQAAQIIQRQMGAAHAEIMLAYQTSHLTTQQWLAEQHRAYDSAIRQLQRHRNAAVHAHQMIIGTGTLQLNAGVINGSAINASPAELMATSSAPTASAKSVPDKVEPNATESAPVSLEIPSSPLSFLRHVLTPKFYQEHVVELLVDTLDECAKARKENRPMEAKLIFLRGHLMIAKNVIEGLGTPLVVFVRLVKELFNLFS